MPRTHRVEVWLDLCTLTWTVIHGQYNGVLCAPTRLSRLPSHNNIRAEKSCQAFNLSDNKPSMGRRQKMRQKSHFECLLLSDNDLFKWRPLRHATIATSRNQTTHDNVHPKRRTTAHIQGTTIRAKETLCSKGLKFNHSSVKQIKQRNCFELLLSQLLALQWHPCTGSGSNSTALAVVAIALYWQW